MPKRKRSWDWEITYTFSHPSGRRPDEELKIRGYVSGHYSPPHITMDPEFSDPGETPEVDPMEVEHENGRIETYDLWSKKAKPSQRDHNNIDGLALMECDGVQESVVSDRVDNLIDQMKEDRI